MANRIESEESDDNSVQSSHASSIDLLFPHRSQKLRKFILQYKKHRCLWDRQHADYKSAVKREQAIADLTELARETNPNATSIHVIRKIESMRACMRRERNRVKVCRYKAKNPNDIYKPKLWYYDLFSFLYKEDDNTQGTSTNEKNKSETNANGNVMESEQPNQTNHQELLYFTKKNEHLICEEVDVKVEPEDKESDDDVEIQFEENQLHSTQLQMYEQPMESTEYSAQTNMVEVPESSQHYHFEEDKTRRQRTEVTDEYDAIGVNVAAKLRGLPQNMRILAEKLINDVLFQAQLNALNSSSIILSKDPIKQETVLS